MWLYPLVTSTGIRELKDNLSRYIRRIEAGERIANTVYGRVVAELVPPDPEHSGSRKRTRAWVRGRVSQT
jgi:antitoxin (DNA-binding transcriptional repressor) of toxin-antitoxin stability system